jgi:cbb3-type cytochrome oxidase maturation protein
MSSSIVGMMLGASIFLGSIALVAFLWGLKTGQFDDEEKMMNTVRFDSDEDLREAAELQKRKEKLKKKKKEYKPE